MTTSSLRREYLLVMSITPWALVSYLWVIVNFYGKGAKWVPLYQYFTYFKAIHNFHFSSDFDVFGAFSLYNGCDKCFRLYSSDFVNQLWYRVKLVQEEVLVDLMRSYFAGSAQPFIATCHGFLEKSKNQISISINNTFKSLSKKKEMK